MTVQPTDRLVVTQGQSYYVEYQNIYDDIDDFAQILVNRSGVNYSLRGAKFKDNDYGDNDSFIVIRNGVNYKCLGSKLKRFIAPTITSASWSFNSKNSNGSIFRMTMFTDRAMDFSSNPTVSLNLAIGSSTFSKLYLKGTLSSLGGPIYLADTYVDLFNGPSPSVIGTSFNYSAILGFETRFELFIPSTITKNGSSANAGSEFGGDPWSGNVKFLFPQGAGDPISTNEFTFSSFTSTSSMFN